MRTSPLPMHALTVEYLIPTALGPAYKSLLASINIEQPGCQNRHAAAYFLHRQRELFYEGWLG
jgi:hypothetical protein